MNLLYLHIVVNKQMRIDRRVLMQISRCWIEVRANIKSTQERNGQDTLYTQRWALQGPLDLKLANQLSDSRWRKKISTFRYCFVHIRSNPDFHDFQVSPLHRFMKGLWNITRSSSKTRWAPSLVAYRTYPYCCGFAKERLQLCLTLTRQLTNYVLA